MKMGDRRGIGLNVLYIEFALTLWLDPVYSLGHRVRMAMMGNSIRYGAKLTNPATECDPNPFSEMLTGICGDTCKIIHNITQYKLYNFYTYRVLQLFSMELMQKKLGNTIKILNFAVNVYIKNLLWTIK